MLTATALAIFYVPLFFVVVARLFSGKSDRPEESVAQGPVVPA
jgi:multidrug efflux pump